MTWTTLVFILVAWCLVSVVAGFALAFFFGGMTRVRPDPAAPGPAERIERARRKDRERFPRQRIRARTRAGTAYRPLPANGVPDPPLDEE